MRVTVDVACTGLSTAEVAERVAAGHVNTLPPRSGRTVWDIVRTNVFTRINALLLVLFVLVLITGDLLQGLWGFLIIVNSGIGIVQELRAKHTLDNLAIVGEGKPRVRRDGLTAELPREQVVLDDIIEIGPGDQIVVDGELVETSYLEIDESLLTGESDPVEKSVGDEVMSGSFVVAGIGAFRATRVGSDSYAAQLTAAANKFSLTKSELQSGINVILRVLGWVLVPVGALTAWVQWNLPHDTWQQAMLRMAGALVAMVPEGLVLLTALAFALAVVRLGKVNVLVQELPAVEGLARVDVVCADKTGTLTENGLRFRELITCGPLDEDACRAALGQLVAADITPNASAQAIAEEMGAPDAPWEVGQRWPFTSAKKWSAATLTAPGAGPVTWMLGAPDVLAAPDSPVAGQAGQLGASGGRVLLFGRLTVSESEGGQPPSNPRPFPSGSHPVADADLAGPPGFGADDPNAPTPEPLALVVLDQRLRPEARDTLAYFASQDVALKVISGDNAQSVGAVVQSLGVMTGAVVDARTLPEDPAAFAEAVESGEVFGRVTPAQKRQMIAALQSRGHNVAMTGDGVNDVLAIKDADLGVAMGSGASATRGVAQVVLLDDSFATLPSVVAEGRQVLGNIERVANFFLTKTVYSILLGVLTVIWRVPFPFVPINLTPIGWFTIGIPATLLALAPNRERARPGFLKRVLRFGIPAGMVVSVTTFTTYLTVLPAAGSAHDLWVQASTATLFTLLLGGVWVMIVIARPYRWWKIGMIAVCLVGYPVISLIPLGRSVFRLDPSNQPMMLTGLLCGLVAIVLVEALWWLDGRLAHERRHLWTVE